MGKKGRLHKEAVINGEEPPFRASPDKPKTKPITPVDEAELSDAVALLARAKRLSSGHDSH